MILDPKRHTLLLEASRALSAVGGDAPLPAGHTAGEQLAYRRGYSVGYRTGLKNGAAQAGEFVEDGARLDFLEAEANSEAIALHSGDPGGSIPRGIRGLGLSKIGRTIRRAIDDMRGKP